VPTALTRAITRVLRARIGELNTSATDVARRAEMPQSTMSRLLNDKKPIYVEQLDTICRVLGLEIGRVLDEADRAARRAHLRAVESPLPDNGADDIDDLITLNPAASDPADGYDPDAEVEAQQDQP
jgi:DNA-binding Xre family transcriptional regulator